jgi:hypothetical protein
MGVDKMPPPLYLAVLNLRLRRYSLIASICVDWE